MLKELNINNDDCIPVKYLLRVYMKMKYFFMFLMPDDIWN